MNLNKEQLDKLVKLEQDIENKRLYEEENRDRKLATSKRTGVPFDLVDTDVVKFGTMLGLIRSVNALENRDSSEDRFTLLDMFLGGSVSEPRDYSNIPKYFVLSSTTISENEQSLKLQQYVALECKKYSGFINDFLRTELNILASVVYITLSNLTIESYVSTIMENINIVLDSLKDEDDEELWIQLTTLRNSLLGPLQICDYKNLTVSHIDKLASFKKHQSAILKHLSFIDANLTLFPGFKNTRFNPQEIHKIYKELIIRTHEKDPELKPFNLNLILKQCCVPSILFLDIKDVIKFGLIGPYRNNPICYISNECFYILKNIDKSIRMWVLDESLTTLSERLRRELLSFSVKLFKTYFKEYTGSNDYSKESNTVIDNIKCSLTFLTRPSDFRTFIRSVVMKMSQLTPSNLDVFDDIPTKTHSIPLVSSVSLPSNLFDTKFPSTFTIK